MPDSETSRVDSRQIDFATFLFSCLPLSFLMLFVSVLFPGIVAGQFVEAGQQLAVVEAMKMQVCT